MHVVHAELSLCEGYANCVMAASDYFDVDDDTGKVTILQEEVPDTKLAHVEYAVRSCPTAALRLSERT